MLRRRRIAAYGLCRDDEGRVLLVRATGGAASAGRWLLPGGGVNHGEDPEDTVRREVEEETGLDVRVAGLVGVLDRVTRDADGRVRYHWVLVDYLAYPQSNDTITAGSDAAEVRWVTIDEVERLPITEGLADMIKRAAALAGGGVA